MSMLGCLRPEEKPHTDCSRTKIERSTSSSRRESSKKRCDLTTDESTGSSVLQSGWSMLSRAQARSARFTSTFQEFRTLSLSRWKTVSVKVDASARYRTSTPLYTNIPLNVQQPRYRSMAAAHDPPRGQVMEAAQERFVRCWKRSDK